MEGKSPEENNPNTPGSSNPTPENPSVEKKNESKNKGGETTLSRVRTYQDAIQEALRTQSMSTTKMLMAEQRKRDRLQSEEERTSIRTPKNKMFLGIAVGLIVIAIVVFFITFITKPSDDPLSEPKDVIKAMFFDPDGFVQVESAQLSRNTILKLQQIISSPFANNSFQQIIITKEVLRDPDSSLTLRKPVAYSTNDLLSLLEARVPDTVRRSLDQNYMLGVHVKANNEPYLLFRITNFNNVFAGMFQWERTLAKDMESIFFRNLSVLNKELTNPTVPTPIFVSTTTDSGTSTTIELPQRTTSNTKIFEDEVIANTDARVLKNQSGKTVFFYTYIDEDYLFFGTDVTTFRQTRDRLRTAKLVL